MATGGSVTKQTLTGVKKIETERQLSKTWRSATKVSREARRQIGIINTSFDEAIRAMDTGESLNAASQGVLVSFQKLLDPTSVVRESEYARSASGLALLDRMNGFATKLRLGGAGLTAENLREFADLGTKYLANDIEFQNIETALVKRQAEAWGLDLTTILPAGAIEELDDAEVEGDDSNIFESLTEEDVTFYEEQGFTVTQNENGSYTITE